MRSFIKIVEGHALYPGAVTFDDVWPEFLRQVAELPPGTTLADAVQTLKMPRKTIEQVAGAIRNWRESPSQSPLNGISYIISEQPVPGEPIFPDLMWQTRFLLKTFHPLWLDRVKNPDAPPEADKNKRYITVRGEFARTVNNENGRKEVNDILRMLYLYAKLNSNKKVKLPKWIYRGIRFRDAMPRLWDIMNPPAGTFKERCEMVIDKIIQDGLEAISETHLLSFTARENVAEFFANQEGFVVRVDPSKVSIVTSYKHDPENLDVYDRITGKREYEFIVDVRGYRPKREDIKITDEDYLIAINSPLAVVSFTHDNKEAHYVLDGHKIVARWVWNSSGTGGRLGFIVDKGYWPESRAEIKKEYGFDPLPTEKNIDRIQDFKIVPRKSW